MEKLYRRKAVMRKVRVKMNGVLAVMLSALMASPSVPMNPVLAETVNTDDASAGSENQVLPGDASGGSGEQAPAGDVADGEGQAPAGDMAEGSGEQAPAGDVADGESQAPVGEVVDGENQAPVEGETGNENQAPVGDVTGNEGQAPVEGVTGSENQAPVGDVANGANQVGDPLNGAENQVISGEPAVEPGTPSVEMQNNAAASVNLDRATGAYLFSYDAETATASPFADMTLATQWEKTNALKFATTTTAIQIPVENSISTGTAVFEIEMCPASESEQRVAFKNSKDEVLFVLCVDAKGKTESTYGIYLTNTMESTDKIVELGSYPKNSWCRIRTELTFDSSAELKFRASASAFENSKYSEDIATWTALGTITQEDLQKSGSYANGTVTSDIDGSADHPLDLAAITVATGSKKARWIGDIALYDITGVTLETAPGQQTAGEAFVAGDAAVKVTYSNGDEEVVKLADLLYGVDYFVTGLEGAAAAESQPISINYGGVVVNTAVKVVEPVVTMTGIRIKTEPDKTIYQPGESLDLTGLVVEAVYSNETAQDLAAEAYTVSGLEAGATGYQTINVTYTADPTMTASFRVKVEKKEGEGNSQSFCYIDEEDITALELSAPTGFLSVVNDALGSNETNKLKINGESATKTLSEPISSGKVTFTTVSNHNGKVLGIKILNGEGNALVNYAQQTSGNLNMYKGNEITGGLNTINLASKDDVKNKWTKVETTIDLDASNQLGVLQFEMNVSYKDKYTDEEWIPVKTYTQQDTYVGAASNASANGCATEGITSFEVGGIQFGSQQGEAYVDDILFDDGSGIGGIVTITEKVLKGVAITTEAATKEFPQDGKISTEGLVLTGTYDVTYSNGTKEEKTYKITKYDVECDTSKIADSVPVTLKVTDNGKEFTATYSVKIVAKPDGSYVTFSYTDEDGAAHTGISGGKFSVAGGDVSGNGTNKIKVEKGTSTIALANPCTTGTIHFETEFLTTATSKASLFLRILNSEGKPMVDFAQYGSGNLNLYIDKQTSGTDGAMAGQFGGLPTKQWAKLSVDIDLEQTREQGHLVFDAIVWTKADYAGEWTVHAEFDENLYLNSTMAPSTTGSASTDATVFDVASIELQNAGGTNYYDNMFFEAIRGDVAKELVDLRIEKPAEKTDYTVGDGLNRAGLVLMGTYKYTFPNGDVKQKEAEITKYDVSFDNTQPGENVPVILTAGGLSVSYNVTVRPNTSLDDIEEYLTGYINNKLVNLDGNNVIHINKRQVRLPIETAGGENLSWAVASGNADVTENVLTVVPSAEEKTRVELKVTLNTTNNDGDPVSFSKIIVCEVPREGGKKVDDSLANDESLKYAVETLVERGVFEGQANLSDVETIIANLDREITTEELAVILVNLFDIDTTYADTKISREDVEDDAWYSKYVKAAFQLSVETRDSREGKKKYGIGKGVSKNNLLYMIDRIVHIDQTSLPSDYADRMFE